MLFEGPFDSDEASDAVAEIEERDDVAAAMAEVLRDFVQDSEEYAEEGCVEASLAITCLVAARISGIAPDEEAFHWLDRNPFTVSDDLRELAAAAFAPATRSDLRPRMRRRRDGRSAVPATRRLDGQRVPQE